MTDTPSERLIECVVTRSAAFGLGAALVFAAACGGKSALQGGACRDYAARWTSDVDAHPYECSFDRRAVTLTCRQSVLMQATTWSTLDAFFADNRPIGRFTFDESRRAFGSECTFLRAVRYDGDGRPEALVPTPQANLPGFACGDDALEYTAWDAEGRPIRATAHTVSTLPRPEAECIEQSVTYVYDDANHRYTEHRVDSIGVGCHDYSWTRTFDDDGFLASERFDYPDGGSGSRRYQTLATERVCID